MKTLLYLLWVGASIGLQAATTITPDNHLAYAANAGWIDWRGNINGGAVIGDYVCAGYLYAANVGWINLGNGAPANGLRYTHLSAHDFGVNHDGLGNLQGYAWGANIGWLTFTNRDSRGMAYSGPRVDLFTGKMSGYVWSANVGWISLSNAWAFVQTGTILPGADTDGDGIADAWELMNFGNLSAANATNDYDGDGLSDLQEDRAGTNPKDAGSTLRITSYTINPGDFTVGLTWQSQPTRQYRIFRTDTLAPSLSWSEFGLGLIYPGPGNGTSRSFPDSGSSMGFYKVEAIRPLAP